MPKARVPYSPEFRRQMVDLVRAGRDPDDLAREFEPTAQSIRNWIVQAEKKEGRREDALPGLSAAERDELSRLRRENRKPRPGLPGRPAGCRRALPVHEHEPGLLSDRHHGARARRVQGWLLRVAAATAVQSRGGRCGVTETHSDRARQFAPDLRRTARSRRSAGPRRATWPQTDSAADARGRAAGCLPPAWWSDDDPAGQGCPARAGPGGSQLHRLGSEPALGGRHHVCADGRRVSVSRCRAGPLEPQDRLVDGQPPTGRVGAGRDGSSRGPASTEGRHSPQRPGQSR